MERDVRQNSGEVRGWSHDEAFVIVRPRYELLYTRILQHSGRRVSLLKDIKFNLISYVYSLCIKAVCTTLGCCEDAAAAALKPPAVPP